MKKNIKYLLLLILSIYTFSCQTTADLLLGSNKIKTFISDDDYFEENFANTSIERSKLIIPTNDQYVQLSNEIQSDSLNIYYGIVNDYFYSGNQLNMKSCSGQFQSLYYKVGKDENGLDKQTLESKSFLKNFDLDKNKKTAIFIYSYKLGSMSNSKIFDVINELKQKDSSFDYRIISLDKNDIKNKYGS